MATHAQNERWRLAHGRAIWPGGAAPRLAPLSKAPHSYHMLEFCWLSLTHASRARALFSRGGAVGVKRRDAANAAAVCLVPQTTFWPTAAGCKARIVRRQLRERQVELHKVP